MLEKAHLVEVIVSAILMIYDLVLNRCALREAWKDLRDDLVKFALRRGVLLVELSVGVCVHMIEMLFDVDVP